MLVLLTILGADFTVARAQKEPLLATRRICGVPCNGIEFVIPEYRQSILRLHHGTNDPVRIHLPRASVDVIPHKDGFTVRMLKCSGFKPISHPLGFVAQSQSAELVASRHE